MKAFSFSFLVCSSAMFTCLQCLYAMFRQQNMKIIAHCRYFHYESFHFFNYLENLVKPMICMCDNPQFSHPLRCKKWSWDKKWNKSMNAHMHECIGDLFKNWRSDFFRKDYLHLTKLCTIFFPRYLDIVGWEWLKLGILWNRKKDWPDCMISIKVNLYFGQ